MTGIYHADSIRDVADSLGIGNLSEGVASMLASDVEYRLHQIIEEAARFTRHSKRTTLSTTDIDQAFKVLNIEPVYGHSGPNAPAFKRAIPAVGPPVYSLQDEEIDFDKIVKEEEIPVPRAVSWTAHWLAIEGVQPLIPENPSPLVDKPQANTQPKSRPQANGTTHHAPQPQAGAPAKPHLTTKSHLSRELQQYYARLTDSLLPSNLPESGVDRQVERKRTAALSSLRSDAGLQGILPYLVKWIGDSVVSALAIKSLAAGSGDAYDMAELEDDVDRRVLEVMLMVIHAILDNQTLFVEPYLHMLLPPLLSILLTSALSSSASYSSLPSHPLPVPRTLRTQASSLVSHLLKLHATSYPSLPPRITKTFLVALLDDGSAHPSTSNFSESAPTRKPLALGTKDGAIRGLMGVGREAVLRGVIGGRVGRMLGEEIDRRIRSSRGPGGGDGDEAMVDLSGLGGSGGREGWTEEIRDVIDAFMDALAVVHPSAQTDADPAFAAFGAIRTGIPTPDQLADALRQLTDRIGTFFADMACNKHGDGGEWAVGLAKTLMDYETSTDGEPTGYKSVPDLNFDLQDEVDVFNVGASAAESMEGLQIHGSQMSMGLGMGMGGDIDGLDANAMDAT